MPNMPSVSQELSNRLVELSEIASNSSMNPDLKKAKLDQLAAATLGEIVAELPTLNVASQLYVQAFQSLIANKDWASLPPPRQIKQGIDDLRAVADIIKNIKESFVTDISSIMSIILEIQRKAALAKSGERILERHLTITHANAEFAEKMKAAQSQLVSDLIQAGMQIATGVLQFGSAGFFGVRGAVKASSTVKSSTEQASQLKNALNKKHELEGEIEAADALVEECKSKISTLNDMKMKKGSLTDSDKNELSSLNQKLNIHAAEKAMNTQKLAKVTTTIQEIQPEISRLNELAHQTTAKANAFQSLFSAVSQLLKGMGDVGAAHMKFVSTTAQVDADKESLARNLASSGEQAAQDAYQNLRDSLKSALQMIQAIEQALASSLSSMARIS